MLRAGVFRGLRAIHPAAPIASPFLLRSIATRAATPTAIQLRKPAAFAISSFNLVQKRNAASTVAGRPASEDIPHAIQNAREEAKGITIDIAKIIAAANFDKREHAFDGFSDVTKGVAAEVPKPILYTGLAGAIPYVGTAFSTLYCARTCGLLAAGHAAGVDYDTAMNVLEAAANVQVTYGAVMLSFLGALHWGMEFSAYGGHQGYKRLALGVAPVVFAWSTLALEPNVALAAQWTGFTMLWWADMKATQAGWTPVWYSQYRFYLSILIGTCIIATLAGESWLNPALGADPFRDLSEITRTTKPASSDDPEHLNASNRLAGTSDKLGDIESVEGDAYFVILKHKEEAAGEEAEASIDEGDESAKEHVEEVAGRQAEKEEGQQQGKAGKVKQGAA